jgi:hypothetical protein
MASNTRLVCQRELAKRRYTGRHYPVAGTASGGSTTTLVATRLKYNSADANALDRKFVYNEEQAETGQVNEGGWAGSTGTVTFSPTATTGFSNAELFQILDDPPEVLQDAINRILDNLPRKVFFPLSIHIVQNDCNDMEASTLATDYEIATGAAALAIESTRVFSGAQSLKVTCDNANEYAALKSVINVHEGQSLYAAIMCSVTQGDDAAFRIWDTTGDAEIDSATSDEPAWTELVFQFSTPSGCEQIDARLEGIGADDVTYWDDLQVWASGYHVYELPSWIVRTGQLDQGDVREFPQGTGGPSSDNDYRANERMSRPIPWGWENTDTAGKFKIWAICGSARPFIYADRPYAQLASDTATTTVDLNHLMNWAVRYLEAETAKERDALLGLIRAGAYTPPRAKSQVRYGVRIG